MSRRDVLALGNQIHGDVHEALSNIEQAFLNGGDIIRDEDELIPAAIQQLCEIIRTGSNPVLLARAASCIGTIANVLPKRRDQIRDRGGVVSSLLAMCAPRVGDAGAIPELNLMIHEYSVYALFNLACKCNNIQADIVEYNGIDIMVGLTKSYRLTDAHADCCHLTKHRTRTVSSPVDEQRSSLPHPAKDSLENLVLGNTVSAKVVRLFGQPAVQCQRSCGNAVCSPSRPAFAVDLFHEGKSVQDLLASDGVVWTAPGDSGTDNKNPVSSLVLRVERIMDDGVHFWATVDSPGTTSSEETLAGLSLDQAFPCCLKDAVPSQLERCNVLKYSLATLALLARHRQSYCTLISDHLEHITLMYLLPNLDVCSEAVTCIFYTAGLPNAAHRMAAQGVLEDMLDLCERCLPCLPDSSAVLVSSVCVIHRLISHCNLCRHHLCQLPKWPILAQGLQLVDKELEKNVIVSCLKVIVGDAELSAYIDTPADSESSSASSPETPARSRATSVSSKKTVRVHEQNDPRGMVDLHGENQLRIARKKPTAKPRPAASCSSSLEVADQHIRAAMSHTHAYSTLASSTRMNGHCYARGDSSSNSSSVSLNQANPPVRQARGALSTATSSECSEGDLSCTDGQMSPGSRAAPHHPRSDEDRSAHRPTANGVAPASTGPVEASKPCSNVGRGRGNKLRMVAQGINAGHEEVQRPSGMSRSVTFPSKDPTLGTKTNLNGPLTGMSAKAGHTGFRSQLRGERPAASLPGASSPGQAVDDDEFEVKPGHPSLRLHKYRHIADTAPIKGVDASNQSQSHRKKNKSGRHPNAKDKSPGEEYRVRKLFATSEDGVESSFACISSGHDKTDAEFPAADVRFYNEGEQVSKTVVTASLPLEYYDKASAASKAWKKCVDDMTDSIATAGATGGKLLFDDDRYYTLGSTVPFRNDITHELRTVLSVIVRAQREFVQRTLCGFLNSGEGGTIYLGIDSDGVVSGVQWNRKLRDDFRLVVDQMMHNFKPVVSADLFYIHFVDCVDSSVAASDSMRQALENVFVIELGVRKTAGMIFVTGVDHCFLREGRTTKHLTMDDVRKMVMAEQEKRYIKEINSLRAQLQVVQSLNLSRMGAIS
eukprot:scpid19380/ scgid0412/ 